MRSVVVSLVLAGAFVAMSSCSADDVKPPDSQCPARGRLVPPDGGGPFRCVVTVECKDDRTFSVDCSTVGADDAGMGGTLECACKQGDTETKTVEYRSEFCDESGNTSEAEAVAAATSAMAEACGFDID